MPLFFFHLRIHGHLDEDDVGVELPHLDAVRLEAVAAIGDLVRDAALTGEAVAGEAFEVTDEGGAPVLTMLFSESAAWSAAVRFRTEISALTAT